MCYKRVILTLLISITACGFLSSAEPSIKALIITGQNNHQWEISTPILKKILENTGLFVVDVLQSPPTGGDFSSFKPEFSKYNVVVLDYNGDPWPEDVKKAFVEYVENGGGVVVYHAADNAFPEWKEFNEIIGLGGWGNRNENWGPYVRWRDGKIVRDHSPGPGGAHGTQHAFQIVIRDKYHPITRGLPEVWMHAKDELYSHLRGPANNLTVLATAYSDPAEKGSGEHEPVLFTINYGKGRVFHTVLGHAQEGIPYALQCAGFIVTFQRGAEWAGTGNVTQPIPEDFPGPYEVRLWEEFRHVPMSELLDGIRNFRALDSRAVITQINEYVRVMTSGARNLEGIESSFLEFLKSDATVDAKQFICSKLVEIGTKKSVPVLVELLNHPKLCDSARFALEKIPDKDASVALRTALSNATDYKVKIGLITSLGLRGDTEAVPLIAEYLTSEDDALAISAGSALAEIGTKDSLNALWNAREKVKDSLKLKFTKFALACAQKVLKEKRADEAIKVVKSISEDDNLPIEVKVASLRTLLEFSEKDGLRGLIQSLNSNNSELVRMAVGMCPLVKKDSSLADIYYALEDASPEIQIQAIEVLTSAGRKDALKYIKNALDSDNGDVRKAGIRAIGMLGGREEVRLLLSLAVQEGEEAELAKESLAKLKGEDVGEVMLQELKKEQVSPEVKRLLIPLVSMRRVPGSEEIILKFASDADVECRVSALTSLVENPKVEMFEPVLNLVPNATDEQEKKLIEDLLVKILEMRRDESDKYVSQISNVFERDIILDAKSLLLRVLARSGAPAGWEKIKSLIVPQQSPELANAVFASIKEWPGEEPIQFLLEFAQSNPELPGRETLLESVLVLSDKWSSDGGVFQHRVSSILALNPSVKIKRTALEKLASRKIEESLPLLLEHLRTGEDEVKDALIRTLSGWQSKSVIDAFAELAKTTQNSSIKRQALSGMIKVADSLPDATIEYRNQVFNNAVSMADSTDVMKGVIGGLQNASYPEALLLVTKFLDSSDVRSEAEVATIKLAKTLAGVCPELVRQSLEKVKTQTELPMLKDEADKILSAMGRFEDFITGWLISGPYTNDEINPNMLYEFVFPPEKPEEASKVVWKPVSSGTDVNRPMVVEIHKILGGDNRVAYLKTYVWSDDEQDAKLLLGSDDGVRIWLNGERVFGRNVNRGCTPDDDTVDIHLKKGWNELLAKIRQGSGNWEFCARIRKNDGSPFQPPLKFTIAP